MAAASRAVCCVLSLPSSCANSGIETQMFVAEAINPQHRACLLTSRSCGNRGKGSADRPADASPQLQAVLHRVKEVNSAVDARHAIL